MKITRLFEISWDTNKVSAEAIEKFLRDFIGSDIQVKEIKQEEEKTG